MRKSCHLSVFPGSSEDQTTPMLVTALKGLKVVDVACGSGDAQTLAVTENGRRSQYGRMSDGRIHSPPLKYFYRRLSVSTGQVWSWGDGDYGKLGRGGSDGCKTPKLVEKLQDLDIVKVCCGSQFSVALTKEGQVYTWGKGDNQRLGHGTDEHVRYPKLLDSLQGESRRRAFLRAASPTQTLMFARCVCDQERKLWTLLWDPRTA